jgi:hypothetical protein
MESGEDGTGSGKRMDTKAILSIDTLASLYEIIDSKSQFSQG